LWEFALAKHPFILPEQRGSARPFNLLMANAEDARAYANRGYTVALLGPKAEARADI
jgi:hypothetical protein